MGAVANFDVTPDGRTFVMVRGTKGPGPWIQTHVAVNWLSDLERRTSEEQASR